MGEIGYRCPAEPEDAFVAKGGDPLDAVGRKSFCNGLFAAVDLALAMGEGAEEPAIVTAGDDAADIARFVRPDEDSYCVADVLRAMEI